MKSVIVLFALASAVLSIPVDLVEDESGQSYYLIPLHRERRQTSVDVSKNDAGTRVTVDHKGNILDNGVHKLDGGAFASKQFRPSGPTTLGGNLAYSHIPSGSSLNVGASNTRGFGTDVSAQGNINLINANKGNTRLDAVGEYSRHFGGPGGTGRPDYYGGLQFVHRF